MAIGETKIAELSVEELQQKNPELYASVYETGRKAAKAEAEQTIADLKSENEELKAKNAQDEARKAECTQIISLATAYGLGDYGRELADKGTSKAEAYELIGQKAQESRETAQENFTSSAPPFAGHTEESPELDNEAPTTRDKAISYCRQKYQCSKREAALKARNEFKHLFAVKTNTKEND